MFDLRTGTWGNSNTTVSWYTGLPSWSAGQPVALQLAALPDDSTVRNVRGTPLDEGRVMVQWEPGPVLDPKWNGYELQYKLATTNDWPMGYDSFGNATRATRLMSLCPDCLSRDLGDDPRLEFAAGAEYDVRVRNTYGTGSGRCFRIIERDAWSAVKRVTAGAAPVTSVPGQVRNVAATASAAATLRVSSRCAPSPYPDGPVRVLKFHYKTPLHLTRRMEAVKARRGEDANYVLAEPYSAAVNVRRPGNGEEFDIPIFIPKAFLTDLSSVPWWGRWIVSRVGPHLEASIVHDWLYVAWQREEGAQATRERRLFADDVFRQAMREARVGSFQA